MRLPETAGAAIDGREEVCYTNTMRRSAPGGLPGSEMIAEGLRDLASGRETECALLVSIGAPKLGSLGFQVASPLTSPEHRLYALLKARGENSAHSRYNALIRRLVSFERAASCAS